MKIFAFNPMICLAMVATMSACGSKGSGGERPDVPVPTAETNTNNKADPGKGAKDNAASTTTDKAGAAKVAPDNAAAGDKAAADKAAADKAAADKAAADKAAADKAAADKAAADKAAADKAAADKAAADKTAFINGLTKATWYTCVAANQPGYWAKVSQTYASDGTLQWGFSFYDDASCSDFITTGSATHAPNKYVVGNKQSDGSFEVDLISSNAPTTYLSYLVSAGILKTATPCTASGAQNGTCPKVTGDSPTNRVLIDSKAQIYHN